MISRHADLGVFVPRGLIVNSRSRANSYPTTFSTALTHPSCAERTTLNQLTTLRWPLDVAVKRFREAELPAIGVSWRKLNEYGLRRGIQLIRSSELDVSSLGWIGGFTGADRHRVDDVLEEGRLAIATAAHLNAGCVTMIGGPKGTHIRSNATRLVEDALKYLGEAATIHGVRLALQPMHPLFERRWTFLNSLDETLELLDRVNCASIQLGFGSYHLWQEEHVMERIREVTPRTALVSLSDWKDRPKHDNDRHIPGTGQLPLTEMIATFEQSGYSGWYEIEVWSKDLWKKDHRDLMQQCRDAAQAVIPKVHQRVAG